MLSTFDNVIVNDILFSNNQIYRAFFEKSTWSKEKILEKLEEYNNLCPEKLEDNYEIKKSCRRQIQGKTVRLRR